MARAPPLQPVKDWSVKAFHNFLLAMREECSSGFTLAFHYSNQKAAETDPTGEIWPSHNGYFFEQRFPTDGLSMEATWLECFQDWQAKQLWSKYKMDLTLERASDVDLVLAYEIDQTLLRSDPEIKAERPTALYIDSMDLERTNRKIGEVAILKCVYLINPDIANDLEDIIQRQIRLGLRGEANNEISTPDYSTAPWKDLASRPQEDPDELFMHTLMQSLMDDRFQMALTAMQPDSLTAPTGVSDAPWLWNNQPLEDAQDPVTFTAQLEKALQRLPVDKSDDTKQIPRGPSELPDDAEGDEPDFSTLVAELGLSGGYCRNGDEHVYMDTQSAEQMLVEIDRIVHQNVQLPQDDQCPQQ